MHVELLHSETVLGIRIRTRLKRDCVSKMAARRVENGPLGLGERFQALGEVGFGERNEGAAYGGIVWSLGELDLYFSSCWDATHELCVGMMVGRWVWGGMYSGFTSHCTSLHKYKDERS
jgi:hypothetical protein